MLHCIVLRQKRTHAVAKQDDGQLRIKFDDMQVDSAGVCQQKIPAVLIGKVAGMRAVRAVATMIVHTDDQARGHGSLRNTCVAASVLAETMQNLEHGSGRASRGPYPDVNLVAVRRNQLTLSVFYLTRQQSTLAGLVSARWQAERYILYWRMDSNEAAGP